MARLHRLKSLKSNSIKGGFKMKTKALLIITMFFFFTGIACNAAGAAKDKQEVIISGADEQKNKEVKLTYMVRTRF
jgi:hypothetical protein